MVVRIKMATKIEVSFINSKTSIFTMMSQGFSHIRRKPLLWPLRAPVCSTITCSTSCISFNVGNCPRLSHIDFGENLKREGKKGVNLGYFSLCITDYEYLGTRMMIFGMQTLPHIYPKKMLANFLMTKTIILGVDFSFRL